MIVKQSLHDQVWQRANGRCEYCRMPQEFDPLPFQIDHIIAQQHRGQTTLENLALSCLACNNHKGPNVAGVDPEQRGSEVVRLFHPRQDRWDNHFEWNGPILRGKTAIGRVTEYVLAVNLSYRIALRQALIEEGVFPPAS